MCYEYVLESVQEKNDASLPPIISAIKKRDIRKVRQLLESGVSIDTKDDAGQNLLLIAVHTGDQNLVRLLMEYGADPDGDHGQALHIPATNGSLGMNALLLDHGADIDQQSAFEQQTACFSRGMRLSSWKRTYFSEPASKGCQGWLIGFS